MKIGLSFVTLVSAAVLALTAGAAEARVGTQATVAKAQAAEAAAAWQRIEATYFNKTKRHQSRHQASHCSLRPDDCTGLRGILS
jgi:hypothetical protein